MGIQITILYKKTPLTFDVSIQEEKIYQLRLQNGGQEYGREYIPEKIVIRRKGIIWVSDLDDYEELVDALTNELLQLDPQTSD